MEDLRRIEMKERQERGLTERDAREVCEREREREKAREKRERDAARGVGTARATEASIIHSVTGRCVFT